MTVKLALEGKIRDKSVKEFIKEYEKRLSPWFKLETAELEDSRKYFDKLNKQNNAFEIVAALDAKGRKFTSEKFADWFEEKRSLSKNITFVIGEASGLSEAARKAAVEYISLSDMTLSYRVSLMVMAEQIYRAMTIIAKHPYHK
ncbi:MAG: 23S rRNA (pseudouridine(1915)-N(3))-methyltransferase RlmH [Mucispirillum sp.]|nr:23S rRNA (pseudouridine(1915)-N(3))-methyltransferase RlmH [Mucispirillum sp.]